MMRVFLFCLIISSLSITAQIEIKIDYEPEWLILGATPDFLTVNKEDSWKSVNRKNYPAAFKIGDTYFYNWYTTQAKDINVLPIGYRFPSENDFSSFGDALADISSNFYWINTPSDSEYGKQIHFVSGKWKKEEFPKYNKALVAVVKDMETFYKDFTEGKAYKELNAATNKSTINLNSSMRDFYVRKQDFLMKGNSACTYSLKGNLFFGSDNINQGLVTTGNFEKAPILTDSLNSIIDEWSLISYPFAFDENKNKIQLSSVHEIDFAIHKRIKLNKVKSIAEYNFANADRGDIEKKIGNNKVSYTIQNKSILLNLNGTSNFEKELKIDELINIKTLGIKTFKNSFPSSYLGYNNGYRKFYKRSILFLGMSYLSKKLFYNRYLENPYDRNGSYKIANASYKIMLLSGVTLGTTFIFDLGGGISNFNRLKKNIREINSRLE